MTKVLRSPLLFIAVFANAVGCKPDFAALKKGDGGGGGSDVNDGGRGGSSSGGSTSATSGGACDGDCAGSGTLPNAGAGGSAGSSGLAGSAGTVSAGAAGIGGTYGGSGGSNGGSAGTAGVAGAAPTCEITPYVLNATPTLIYDFDIGSGSVAVDSSGNSLHGSFVGTPVWNTTGRLGGALNFNAANQYVELPADVLKNMSAVTIATWVKLSANPASSTLFDFGSNPTNHFYLRTNAGAGTTANISFGAIVNGGTPQELITTYSLPTGVWKHVALTVGDGVAALYVDGLKIASRTVSFAPSALGATAGNWIGHSHTSTTNLYGSVDDFRIYPRALEPKEVQSLAPPGADYLHFNFDEPCGDKAYDRSDLALVGTLPAGATWTSGFVGGALSLNGTGQYLELPPNVFQLLRPIATQPCSDLTVAMWVQRLDSRDWERLFSFGQSPKTALSLATTNSFKMMQFSAKLNSSELRGAADEQVMASSSTALSPQTGLWGHVAVVLQGGTGRLYFNGQEVGTGSITIKPSDMGATVINAIGLPLYPGEPHLNANIDDLRISCRAFPPSEIKILAIAGQ